MGYLVIQRRIGERILIGDDIEILISDAKVDTDGTVDIAIKAPKHLNIKRLGTHIEEQKSQKNRSKQRGPR